jgi:hypothetical protein
MNCTNLLENLGYACAPRAGGALRLWSPFTFDDGEHLAVFLEPGIDGQWLITDHADTLMHASAHGARITPQRLDRIRQKSAAVTISEGGVLSTIATPEALPNAITAVLNTAIAISHAEAAWRPKTHEQRFLASVGKELEAVAGKHLQRGVSVNGASGHQIEFPFAIDTAEARRQFIQPVAYGDERMDCASCLANPAFIATLDPEKNRQEILQDRRRRAGTGQPPATEGNRPPLCRMDCSDKVEIRSIRQANLLHGKLYHIHDGHREHAILGSSNFTRRAWAIRRPTLS